MIPIDEGIEMVFRRLYEDRNLEERTNMPPDRICSLVKLCITVIILNLRIIFMNS